MAATNDTLTQPGGFQVDAQVSASDPGAGSLESKTVAGATVHRAAPHLQPASK